MVGHSDLLKMADALDSAVTAFEQSSEGEQLKALDAAADRVAEAFSGSWFGYHSRVYFADFEAPAPGQHFDPEYGLMYRPVGKPHQKGEWLEFKPSEVVAHIQKLAGVLDFTTQKKSAEKVRQLISETKSEAASIIEVSQPDEFLKKLKAEIEAVSVPSRLDLINSAHSRGKIITHDIRALNEGSALPPHMDVKGDIWLVEVSFLRATYLASIVRRAASHMERLAAALSRSQRVGTNIFIGHGRSKEWLELKSFISDRLKLPWDEFNRVPVAGFTNIARLSQMLDAASFGFLVMTGEDETAEGQIRARENVVHEAGLFQGRLGFERAIILIEDGCEEFSNIHGLGQIRFPKRNIKACFEQIREVLEREGIISSD